MVKQDRHSELEDLQNNADLIGHVSACQHVIDRKNRSRNSREQASESFSEIVDDLQKLLWLCFHLSSTPEADGKKETFFCGKRLGSFCIKPNRMISVDTGEI